MPFFQMVMRETRMHFLLRMLRCDDITPRNEHRQTDCLAPIQQIFTQFVENCKTVYSLGDTFTIDEMLVGFCGQCPFCQYIPSKPAKYGIKIYSMVDSRTYFTYNMEVYCGQQPVGEYRVDNRPFKVVNRLIAPVSGSGWSAVVDNWFMSYKLADELKRHQTSRLPEHFGGIKDTFQHSLLKI